jgi:LIVCS family branched-chain amino acid:cation transporter
MFFGSGNLVFPLQIGQMVGSQWILGFLGLLLTGILLPFLGLFVIKLHRGSYNAFFKEAGPIATFLLPLFTLSLLGSFGIVPRCITVAYGGMSDFMPQVSLLEFSIIFSVFTFFLCLKDTFMVKMIGTWMSPILLVSLIILIYMGIIKAPPVPSSVANAQEAFTSGFLIGYQTMDLFAAFFFSALVFAQIQNAMGDTADHKSVLRFAIKPSIIGASLLALIYLGFVYLGAHYADLIKNIAPESMLSTIADHTMGEKATLVIGAAILFSCLTTAVALNNIYAQYLRSLFKIKERHFPLILMGTTGISFMISLLDFKGIAAFLAPALEVSYPGIIALTVLSIALKGHQNLKKYTFYSITVVMVIHWALSNFYTS